MLEHKIITTLKRILVILINCLRLPHFHVTYPRSMLQTASESHWRSLCNIAVNKTWNWRRLDSGLPRMFPARRRCRRAEAHAIKCQHFQCEAHGKTHKLGQLFITNKPLRIWSKLHRTRQDYTLTGFRSSSFSWSFRFFAWIVVFISAHFNGFVRVLYLTFTGEFCVETRHVLP